MATQLGNVAVGTVLKLNENGTPQNYIVVHQGLPSSMYDASCNGTWLLRQDIFTQYKWDNSGSNVYLNSNLVEFLEGDVIPLFSSAIQSAIKTVKIPYCVGGGSSQVNSGANGYSCKVFLLGGYEVGFTVATNNYFPTDGAKLAYFEYGTGTSNNSKRIANFNGSPINWWLRSPYTSGSILAWCVRYDGFYTSTDTTAPIGIRPAMVMPTNLIVDDNNNITANVVPSAPGSITVPTSSVPAGSAINVTWTAGTNATGYALQRSVNGGNFQTVYTGANLSYSDTALNTWTSAQYQVASTASGFTSAYITSTTVTILPYTVTTFTVPSQVMQGQTVPISWGSVSGADTYVLQRKVDSGEWEQVYSGGDTSYTDTAASWTTVQYQIQAGSGSVFGTWTTSGVIPVIAASALVISGTDGNLGTLTADVPYTISSDTGNPITLTRTVNGVLVASLTVQNGFAYNIPVMDLPTGTGTIVISATVQATSGSVSASRTWTYTKVPFSFPGTGSTAQLQQDGNNVFPATLAECVRVGKLWNGSLDKALEMLGNAATYTATAQPKYSEVTVSLAEAQVGDIVNLPYNGVMVPHIVVQIGNPDAEMYDSSCNGVWLLRQDCVAQGQWNSTNVNTLSGSTIMTTMQGYVENYDTTVSSQIQTVKIPYCVGGGDTTVQTLENGLQCQIFPLGGYEVGWTTSDSPYFPTDGAVLAYFQGTAATDPKRIAYLNGSTYSWLLRSSYTEGTTSVWYVDSNGNNDNWYASDYRGIRPCFILPTTFSATYFVDPSGTIHAEQEYTTAGNFADLWGNAIPVPKIETGSYTGTGTYGESNPNTLTFSFDPKIVFIAAVNQSASVTVWQTSPFVSNQNLALTIASGQSPLVVYLNWGENSVSWYNSSGPIQQMNNNATTYSYVAIG